MPEGKTIMLSSSEYRELEGLKAGDMIPKMTVTDSKVESVDGSGNMKVVLGPTEFEMEGMADREMKKMREQSGTATYGNAEDEE